MAAYITDRLVGHQRVVDTQDNVSFLQSDEGRRHILIRLIDDNTVQFLVLTDKGTDTGIFARKHHPQVFRLILRIIFRIRVKTAQHCIDTRADDILRI